MSGRPGERSMVCIILPLLYSSHTNAGLVLNQNRTLASSTSTRPVTRSWHTSTAPNCVRRHPSSQSRASHHLAKYQSSFSYTACRLGCAAIFLIGGPTRDTEPIPILLRSGDVLIMSGPCRRAYHGMHSPTVPRFVVLKCLMQACRGSSKAHAPFTSSRLRVPLKLVRATAKMIGSRMQHICATRAST